MKILHSFILFSNEVGSGTTDFMYKICKAQAKVGLKPTILSGSYAFDQVLADTLDDVDFHVEKTWFYKQGFSLMPRLILWCRKNLKQYDVVHMHVYRTFQNIVLYYYCRKYKIPYVIDAHGSVLYFIKKIFIKKMFDKFIGKSILKNASFLLAESKKGIEEYKRIVPDLLDSKFRIIYPSFDLEEFKSLPDHGRFRKSQGLSSEINIVMFVGRLNPIKGLEFLIKSFSKFASNSHNSKLYIVGEDDGTGYRASLVDIIKEYQLESSVVFSGFLTGYDKLSAVMDASVLVQCSRLEQGPRVPFEAVLLGTPIIVTKHTGSGELVTQFDAGQVVEYNNTEQLSQSLQSVISNLEHARNRTNKAAIKIKKNMSLEKVVIQYQELYVAAKKSVL
ncbi:glycosyltransferase [Alphaproteobacteria bacterium]|nr:glycosyltransferase [Alphaproteobacteria bacterium]